MNPLSLGVHIIVRDEAEWLPQCLESIRNADEIIVVDTGSEDNSVSIARSFGAAVIEDPWKEDFSHPRNKALKHASTDWILVLDADECLLGGIDQLRAMLASGEWEAYSLTIENLLGSRPEERLYHSAVRLFRSRPEYRFEGRIHEQIGSSIVRQHPGKSMGDAGILIRHYGYLPSILDGKKKARRNEDLLLKALEENPDDPFYLYNLGITHHQLNRPQAATEVMAKALPLVPVNAPYRAGLIRDLAKLLLSLGKAEQAQAVIDNELSERYEDYPDLHVLLGDALLAQGWTDKAFDSYTQAAQLAGCSDRYVQEAGSSSFTPLSRMGSIALRLGRPEEAARLFHGALQQHATHQPSLSGIAESFRQLDVSETEIAALLKQIVLPQQPADYLPIFEALNEAGADQGIESLWQQAMTAESRLVILYASALLRNGKSGVLPLLTAAALLNDSTRPDELETIGMLLKVCRTVGSGEQSASAASLDDEITFDKLIQCAVEVRAWQAAETFARRYEAGQLALAKAMYRSGFVLQAADRFLGLLESRKLDSEAFFMLGELLYTKNHFAEAAQQFEQAQAMQPDQRRAGIGLSLCYLQLAARHMDEAVHLASEQTGLREDLGRIQAAIQLLARLPWQTDWNGRQRRNRDGEAAHITLHDRPQ
ncbi:tetratricopeptide repeat-containing glycosyltransferase family 2 protein [Paenibacillus sambharensis]|nr:glycosyltransferase family 2 protein [Paenibacillus sambharensis]